MGKTQVFGYAQNMELVALNFVLIIGLSAAFVALILLTQNWHGRFSVDYTHGTQKFHSGDTARIGGLSIYFALVVWQQFQSQNFQILNIILLSALPVFLAGLADDFTNKINWRWRLGASFVTAFLFLYLSGYRIRSIDFPIIELLFQWPVTSTLLTAIAIAGITNSINIIDGFNGLASGAVLIMFASIALFAMRSGDNTITYIAILHIGVILGFMLFNFPWGKIFLGDAGAYYLGFALSVSAIMLFERNHSISPWSVALILAYPLIETLFTIYRRWARKGQKTTQPDRIHLHQLIYRSVGRPYANRFQWKNGRNPISGATMWLFPLMSGILAQICLYRPFLSLAALFGFFLFYLMIYMRLSHMKPKRKR